MKKIFIIIFIVSALLNTVPILAQSKVLINEFLIDPQPQSVEIFNSGTESADISDWIIDDSGGTTFYTIPKNNIIFPNQCLIYFSDFNLNKASSDTIRLVNSSQQLIDSFSYKSSSGSGISYFRFSDGSSDWATGSANLGLYNRTDVSCLVTPALITLTPTTTIIPTSIPVTITPTTPPPPTETTIPTATPTLESYENIYISEVMVSPQTGEKEWVEIYNDNDFSVSLKNWYIDDQENSGSTPKIFSLEISKKNYAVLDLSSSIFNNDGDNIRLLDFNKNTKDDLEYKLTEQGKTLGKTNFDSDDLCIQEPSKNSVNNPCITPTLLPPTRSVLVEPVSAKIVQPKKPTNNFTASVFPTISQTYKKIDGFYRSETLGITDKFIADTPSNGSLIGLLTVLSISYSLLTIGSILFKMRLFYGKDKSFYSSTFRSS